MVRMSAPGTSTSKAPMSGTDSKPISRQAAAGKEAVRSGVDVKITALTDDGTIELVRLLGFLGSFTPAPIAPAAFASTWSEPLVRLLALGQGSLS